jgi:DedD protein
MAKQSVSEEEIQLRKRARRRLVGAVALTILAAIFLPMVFDDQQKPVGNVQIQIPDEKTAAPFLPLPVSAPPAASAPLAASAVKAAPEVHATAKPAPEKSAKPDKKPPEKAAKTDKAGEFVVQLGVFSNAANVKELRAKLSSAGIRTYVESVKAAGGEKTRVRAGPYATKSDAEHARKRIAKSGINGVVEPR